MKLSRAMSHINQALNYPAVTFADVRLFFDQAIADLNTSLHIAVPSFSDMAEEYIRRESEPKPNVVSVSGVSEGDSVSIDPSDDVHYDIYDREYVVMRSGQEFRYKSLYGIDPSETPSKWFRAVLYSSDQPVWVEIDATPNVEEMEISDYLPDDWVLLWLIPYVCYKYSVRDGGSASAFADEITQGYMQLQDAYDVPHEEILARVAGMPAYADDVERSLPDLTRRVKTKAIRPEHSHSRNPNARYGSMYDNGGFGI